MWATALCFSLLPLIFMLMRFPLLFLMMIVSGVSVVCHAVSPYPVLETRADRFFEQKEWTQAAAVYDLMLHEKPGVPATYGKAIVANAMRRDSIAEMALMAKALDNHIPFDSVFSRVRSTSFELGRTYLYEDFLQRTKVAYPWMRRTIDSYLLRYYVFRRNGEKMIEYSRIMLAGAPDNVAFMTSLADGAMLCGDDALGTDAYRMVLAHDPKNVNALLNLGNWYAIRKDTVAASGYLERAYEIAPTPYVAEQLRLMGKNVR